MSQSNPGTQNRPRRVGVAGAGWVSQFHLTAWRALGARAAVVAIADPDGDRLAAARGGFGIGTTFASAEQMIAEADIDVLDICAPREAHAPLVRLAARRDLAVICQKPLAPTFAEAEALAADVDGRIRLMVHENWRFRATYRRLREWLDEGVAGSIRRVELDYLSSGMIPDASGVRPAVERQSSLPAISRMLVMEALIHQLDTLRYLCGELELISAVIARSTDDIAGEDSATLTMRRARDGIPVELVGDLAAHGEPPQARDQLRLFGSDATIVLDGYDLRCTGVTNRRESFDPDATYQGSYTATFAHFLDCLDSGAPFATNPADNLRTLALVEAAYASAGEFIGGELTRPRRGS